MFSDKGELLLNCMLLVCDSLSVSPQPVFIDHNSRYTSYIDPRLPYPGNDLTETSSTSSVGVVVSSIASYSV